MAKSPSNKRRSSSKNPKNRRTLRSGSHTKSNYDDANSVDTPKQQGNQSNALFRKHILYCDVTLKVKAAKKGTEELCLQCQTLLRVLQDADDSVALVKYRTDAGSKNMQGDWKVGKDVSVTKMEDIPATITALGQYFHRARPYSAVILR